MCNDLEILEQIKDCPNDIFLARYKKRLGRLVDLSKTFDRDDLVI